LTDAQLLDQRLRHLHHLADDLRVGRPRLRRHRRVVAGELPRAPALRRPQSSRRAAGREGAYRENRAHRSCVRDRPKRLRREAWADQCLYERTRVKRRARCDLEHGQISSGGAVRRLVLPGALPATAAGTQPTSAPPRRALSGNGCSPAGEQVTAPAERRSCYLHSHLTVPEASGAISPTPPQFGGSGQTVCGVHCVAFPNAQRRKRARGAAFPIGPNLLGKQP